MNTKILIPVMLAVISVSAVYLIVGADDAEAATGTYTDGDFTFNVVDGNAVIKSTTLTGSNLSLNIPSTVSDGTNTYDVTSIGSSAFYNVMVSNVTIPDSVTSIGSSAFSRTKLQTVTIPDSVTSIGNYTFDDIRTLTSINIPDSVTSIGESAFSNTKITSIIIPSTITSIPVSMCAQCTNLTTVTMSDTVTSIGESAFGYCTSLASFDIPDSVTSIGNEAFRTCGAASFDIPDSVTSIGNYAFAYSDGLTEIIIRGTPETIGTDAFASPNLATVYNLGSNDTIVAGAYGIPSTATVYRTMQTFTYEIVDGYATITGTTGEDWTDVTIPSIVTSGGVEYTVTTIGANNAPIISSNQLAEGATLTIPEGITEITTNAFNGLSGLTGSLVLPSSLTSIGTQAFNQCTGFTGTLTIPASADVLRETFKGCSGFTALVIEEGVSFIGPGAFSQCTGLTGALALPASLTSISSSAFSNCSGLTALDLEDVSSIGDNAFYGDAGLTGVLILNENISSVGNFAFNYTGYDGLVIVGTPTIAATAFNDTSIKQVLNLGDNEITTTSYGLNADEIREDIPAYGIIAPASVTEEIENEGAVYDLVAILPILIVASLTLMIVAYAIRARLS